MSDVVTGQQARPMSVFYCSRLDQILVSVTLVSQQSAASYPHHVNMHTVEAVNSCFKVPYSSTSMGLNQLCDSTPQTKI